MASLPVAILSACSMLFLFGFIFATIVLRSPFEYPHFTYVFDTTGLRQSPIDDLVDRWLASGGFAQVRRHWAFIAAYKEDAAHRIERSAFGLRGYRRRQYLATLDDARAFWFVAERVGGDPSRARYVGAPYAAAGVAASKSYSYDQLAARWELLTGRSADEVDPMDELFRM